MKNNFVLLFLLSCFAFADTARAESIGVWLVLGAGSVATIVYHKTVARGLVEITQGSRTWWKARQERLAAEQAKKDQERSDEESQMACLKAEQEERKAKARKGEGTSSDSSKATS